jgi:hypothetical protein
VDENIGLDGRIFLKKLLSGWEGIIGRVSVITMTSNPFMVWVTLHTNHISFAKNDAKALD